MARCSGRIGGYEGDSSRLGLLPLREPVVVALVGRKAAVAVHELEREAQETILEFCRHANIRGAVDPDRRVQGRSRRDTTKWDPTCCRVDMPLVNGSRTSVRKDAADVWTQPVVAGHKDQDVAATVLRHRLGAEHGRGHCRKGRKSGKNAKTGGSREVQRLFTNTSLPTALQLVGILVNFSLALEPLSATNRNQLNTLFIILSLNHARSFILHY